MKISLALAQIHIQLGQPQTNLNHAEEMLQTTAGSQLFLLPELWSTGYALPQAAELAEKNRGISDRLQTLSRQNQTWIGGSVLTEANGQVFNTFTLHSPVSAPAGYHKLHLFRLMAEDQFLTGGSRSQIAAIPGCSAGLAICYDLRFPELFRQYALAGAACFLLVAEWPLSRAAHWKTLLRARAIENQAFMIAVNSVGHTGGETFGGGSAVISPWGETIAEAPAGAETLLRAEIDLDEVAHIRSRIPIFQDRRPEIYGDCAPPA